MGYDNPYAGYGYRSYGQQPYGQPPYMQPQPPPPQPPQQQVQQQGPDWVQVQTVNQVEQINVPAGAKAWVMVQNEPVFALRVADQMGLVQTSYYRFEPFDPAAQAAAAQAVPPADYITRDELEARLAEFAGTLRSQPAPTRAKKEAAAE